VNRINDSINAEGGVLFQSLFHEAPVGLIHLGSATEITLMNRAACEMFDISEEVSDEFLVSDLFPSLRVSTLPELQQVFIKRQKINNTNSIEINGVRDDGEVRPMVITASWLGGDPPSSCIFSINDNSIVVETKKERQKQL
jgi:PAS domain-containing protein